MLRNALVQLVLVMLGVTSVHAVKILQNSSVHEASAAVPIGITADRQVKNSWALLRDDSLKYIIYPALSSRVKQTN